MRKKCICISMRLGQDTCKLERHSIQFSHHNKSTNIIQNLSWFGKRLLSLSMKCLPGCMWWSATTMVVLYAREQSFIIVIMLEKVIYSVLGTESYHHSWFDGFAYLISLWFSMHLTWLKSFSPNTIILAKKLVEKLPSFLISSAHFCPYVAACALFSEV